jgi:hypothetical protein
VDTRSWSAKPVLRQSYEGAALRAARVHAEGTRSPEQRIVEQPSANARPSRLDGHFSDQPDNTALAADLENRPIDVDSR